MAYMFAYSDYHSLDLSGFNTSNVSNMSNMFRACVNLGDITIGNDFIIDSNTNIDNMFIQVNQESENRFYINAPNEILSSSVKYICDNKYSAGLNVSNTYTPNESTELTSRYVPFGVATNNEYVYWEPSGSLIFSASSQQYTEHSLDVQNVVSTRISTLTSSSDPLLYDNTAIRFGDVKQIYYDLPENFEFASGTSLANLYYTGNDNNNIELINFGDNFNTSNVTSMYRMFNYCSKLTEVDLRGFSTTSDSSITTMYQMFNGCGKLTSVTFPSDGFTVSGSMEKMFSGCSVLESVNYLSSITGNVTSMGSMFSGCSLLESVTFPTNGFTVSGSMGYMFNSCSKLTSVDLRGVRTTSGNVSMSYMFEGCSSLTEVKFPTTESSITVNDMTQMFYGCTSLTSVNISGFSASGNVNMSSMFYNCSSLTSVNITGISASSISMTTMFLNCSSLTEVNISGISASGNVDMNQMFSGCSALTSVTFPTTESSITVSSMSNMFLNCSSLTTVNISGISASVVH